MIDLHSDYEWLRVEVSAEELELIESAARAEGLRVEDWFRRQLLRAIRQDVQKDHKAG